jgi:hypothetical protein
MTMQRYEGKKRAPKIGKKKWFGKVGFSQIFTAACSVFNLAQIRRQSHQEPPQSEP